MAGKKDREIDKTHLSIDTAEERLLIHRDYLAHVHRWSHVAKQLQKSGAYRTARILDIGCGKEVPLAKMLYVNKMAPALYVGVDANRLEVPEMLQSTPKPWLNLVQHDITKIDPKDFVKQEYKGKSPNVVVSFEMIEHVTPVKATQTLKFIFDVMDKSGTAYISTPCFNGSAAGNHINEMTYEALGGLLEDLGFEIKARYGTFASIKEYQKQLQVDSQGREDDADDADDARSLENLKASGVLTAFGAFEALREYYCTNVLATIFAPLYPQFSRNVLWCLSNNRRQNYFRKFEPLKKAKTPWSSSDKWQTLGKLK